MNEELPSWELAFRFFSNRLCLAFCATVGERWRRCFERLEMPDDLSRWLVEAGLLAEEAAVTGRQLAQARQLREAIYRAVRAAMAGEPVTGADRTVINSFGCHQPVGFQIGPHRERMTWAGRDPVGAGLASVAADAIDLLTSRLIERVRVCGATDCSLLFLDTSRPGRRRWCSDGACGSRSRAAAYRSRRRTPEVKR